MRIKGFKNTQKIRYSMKKELSVMDKKRKSKENSRINSRKNIKNEIEDDDFPDSVYEFAGLNELQNRKTKPSKKENEKVLKQLYVIRKGKKMKVESEVDEEANTKEERKKEKAKDKVKVEEQKEETKEEKIEEVILENETIENEIKDEKEVEVKEEKIENSTEKAEDSEIEKVEEITEENENSLNPEKVKTRKERRVAKHEEKRNIFLHPEDIETMFLEWFDSSKRLAFFVGLIIGIITHITFLTEMLMSQDGLWNSIGYEKPTKWELTIGRWGIYIADRLVHNLAIPNITGIISILFVVIATVLIVDLLKLKNKTIIFLVSTAMVVSPALTGTLIYIYTSVAYSLSMLLAIVTVCLIFKEKNRIINIILAIITLAFTLGIYQSYIGVTIGLAIIKLIKDLFEEDKQIKEIAFNALLMCVVVVLGGVLYYSITEVVLNIMDLKSASYKGMSDVGILNTLEKLKDSIPQTYRDFSDFYFENNIVKNGNFFRDKFYIILFATSILLEIILVFTSKVWKNWGKVILIILLNIILPIALNSIILLVPENSIYILTSAQMMLIFPLVAVIIEKSGKEYTFALKWLALISMFLIVFTYYLSDNASYASLKLTYNQAIAVSNRILARLELAEGYSEDTPVMIVGFIQDDKHEIFSKRSNIYLYNINELFDMPAIHGSYYGMEGTWTKLLNIYLGTRVEYCNQTDYMNILISPEYRQMELYPAQSSIKKINGVMVVKMTNETPTP